MITAFSALILGLVEGFTEFLPISSTAHLILASRLLDIAQSDFAKTFEIAIQSGAILAVLFLYWRRFLEVDLLKKIAAAFLPTAVLGLVFYGFIKDLLGNMNVVLWALALGGALLILFEYAFNEDRASGELNDLTYAKAAGVGLAQSVAMIPGVSRAAATILGGMMLGLKREAIVEFSFLLAVPTMLAATGLDLVQNYEAFSAGQFGVLAVGMVSSFLTAVVSIRWLLGYIRRHSFTAFGAYRIVLVVLFALLVL